MTTYAHRLIDTGAQTTERPWGVYATADGREFLNGSFATEGEARAEVEWKAARAARAARSAEVKKLTITLTDRAPVTIRRADWHVIASAKAWDNQYESQANHTWRITVREHDDGRVIVYGYCWSAWQGAEAGEAGELVAPNDDASYDYLAPVIRRVAAECGCERIADECIADLPATEI